MNQVITKDFLTSILDNLIVDIEAGNRLYYIIENNQMTILVRDIKIHFEFDSQYFLDPIKSGQPREDWS